MATPTTMTDLSVTAASNSPAGSESPTNGDDFLRAIQAIVRRTNAKGSDIASATTTDIGAATAEFVDVTGTTTITGLGTIDAGIVRTVRFTGALTLTYNATSLILPTSANITTANGDVAMFRSLGSGNWKCVGYIRQNGTALDAGGTATTDLVMSSSMVKWAKGADVASATALPLITDGNYFDVTGTTTITSFNSVGVGTIVKLHFDGALILTHHATNLILPGAANITTAAGDEAEFEEYASGQYRCTNYSPADGRALVSPKFKMGSFTRDISTASGTQAVTGVGFTPKKVHFMMALSTASPLASFGFDDGTNAYCLYDNHNSTADTNQLGATKSIVALGTGTNLYTGYISTLGTDGFTITWTKGGTPTGTITIQYLAEA